MGAGRGLGWDYKEGPTTNPNLLHPWPCFLGWVSDTGRLTFVLGKAQVGVEL